MHYCLLRWKFVRVVCGCEFVKRCVWLCIQMQLTTRATAVVVRSGHVRTAALVPRLPVAYWRRYSAWDPTAHAVWKSFH